MRHVMTINSYNHQLQYTYASHKLRSIDQPAGLKKKKNRQETRYFKWVDEASTRASSDWSYRDHHVHCTHASRQIICSHILQMFSFNIPCQDKITRYGFEENCKICDITTQEGIHHTAMFINSSGRHICETVVHISHNRASILAPCPFTGQGWPRFIFSGNHYSEVRQRTWTQNMLNHATPQPTLWQIQGSSDNIRYRLF